MEDMETLRLIYNVVSWFGIENVGCYGNPQEWPWEV